MKDVLMFVTSWCPHCRRALKYMEQLREENPAFQSVRVQVSDEEEERELAGRYDYYLVPTFYVAGEKVHEGVPSLESVRRIFQRALEE